MVFDNGQAPVTNVSKEEAADVPRSKFNMSCVKYTNGIIGALEPIDLLETLPNEDYEIGYDILAQLRNPTVRQALNGMKIFVHTYWSPKKDLWKGFKNYITGGKSGTVTLEVPKLCPIIASDASGGAIDKTNITPSGTDVNTFTPFAPSSFMGLPTVRCYNGTNPTDKYQNKNYWYGAVCGTNSKRINAMRGAINATESSVDSSVMWGVTALPFVMYNKVYRDYYANENMLQKNKNWYHDDEDEDLILPYTLPSTNKTGYTNCTDGDIYNLLPSDFNRAHVPMYNASETNGDKPILNMLHFRQFRGDYFTTANIFKDLLRGDASELNIPQDLDFSGMWEEWANTETGTTPSSRKIYPQAIYNVNSDGDPTKIMRSMYDGYSNIAPTGDGWSDYVDIMKSAWGKGFEKIAVKGVSLNALRKAVVLEKLMMRNATTNGTYRELIGIQFGYYPNDYTRKPVYVGGASYDVNFNTITATNFDATTNNLGQKASDGYASGTGYIGKFHSDDHGYLMTILSIVPDVYYANQGLDTMFTRTTKDQEYTPLLNNLEPMAIKNKELFISGDGTSYNEDVWGYADRFEDWKSRRNKVSGLAVCGELFDRAQFMFREFTETNKPNLNEQFMAMTPENIDLSILTSQYEPPFDLTIGCNITKVSPMPYKAKPANMGIKY